jgi:hypothetical protein
VLSSRTARSCALSPGSPNSTRRQIQVFVDGMKEDLEDLEPTSLLNGDEEMTLRWEAEDGEPLEGHGTSR